MSLLIGRMWPLQRMWSRYSRDHIQHATTCSHTTGSNVQVENCLRSIMYLLSRISLIWSPFDILSFTIHHVYLHQIYSWKAWIGKCYCRWIRDELQLLEWSIPTGDVLHLTALVDLPSTMMLSPTPLLTTTTNREQRSRCTERRNFWNNEQQLPTWAPNTSWPLLSLAWASNAEPNLNAGKLLGEDGSLCQTRC